jgi:CheY-like chemotaxis protein
MFSQEGRALDRSRGGLGIGLALVRSLVEMHGGRIEAHSDGPGRGAVFAVHLPVLAARPAPAPQPRDQHPAGTPARRILVVDDNRDGADSLAMMLRVLGHDTRTAYDGVQAIEAAEKYRPEVVLLDIGLPRMNGYEVCRHVREQAWGEGMLIVAVTGWGQDDDRRRSREAGFDHHLVKPVDPDRLLALLASPRDVATAPG